MTRQSKSSGQTAPGRTPSQECQALAERGDVLALLDYLEERGGTGLVTESLPMINRCLRVRARADLSGLTDDLFARILIQTGQLLLRTQLYISFRLKEAEGAGGHALSALPADLLDEGWIDRAERLSRFVAEMATTRSRVRHVGYLSRNGKHNGFNPSWFASGSSMGSHRGEAAACQGPSGNGGIRRPASTVRFP